MKSITFDRGGQYRAWNRGRSQGPVQLRPVGLVDSGDVAVVRHAAIVALIVAVNTAYYDISRNHYIGQSHLREGFFQNLNCFLSSTTSVFSGAVKFTAEKKVVKAVAK